MVGDSIFDYSVIALNLATCETECWIKEKSDGVDGMRQGRRKNYPEKAPGILKGLMNSSLNSAKVRDRATPFKILAHVGRFSPIDYNEL
ncbi:Hypothetical protein NTJ_04959 [Nesidiocoris tenuis]|uniref:Uncharacterized protein n=1 Tax=Nesidiocoris tenuis TaxID=355587 RepID=A0ABN7AL56_9HEMI|nr:Hypothetical protein NTJ_04959 [Nesidiocoris tenuis]